MAEFPIITGKRFWDFRLNELVDLYSHQVAKYSKDLPSDPKMVADAVIREVEYPFHLGQPDDTHVWNCFHGEYKFCRRVDLDFWQKASETAVLLVGDCEDSSVLYTALAGQIVGPDDVYEVLGLVKDAETGGILGGHGWSVCKWAEPNVSPGRPPFHLIESTLDIPPSEYPIMVDFKAPYKLGKWIYEPMILFNWKNYIEIAPLFQYLKISFKAKETRAKYEAIQQAWSMKTKPLRKAGIVAKLRWKN